MARVWSWLIAVFALVAVGLPAGRAVAAEQTTAVVASQHLRRQAADANGPSAWAPDADPEFTLDPGAGAKHRRGRPVRRIQLFVLASSGDLDPNSGTPEPTSTPTDRLAADLARLLDAPRAAPLTRQPSAPTVATAVWWLRARGSTPASDDAAPHSAC